ncbi:MAG: hypothetical protein IIW02_02775 [Clostridia bacterium]|nr:hypothetical protein [Clostridia bacterium]
MKRSVCIWQLLGFIFTSLSGVLLHFLYNWTGRAAIVAPFCAINESTWEHMKLLFWPMLIFALVQSSAFKNIDSFFCIKAQGIIIGLVLIPVFFYTYNGAIDKSPDWLNISIYFLTAAIVYFYETRKILNSTVSLWLKSPGIAVILLIVVGLLFVIFTYNTPELGIFEIPTSAVSK